MSYRIAPVTSDRTFVEKIYYDRGCAVEEAILQMRQKREPTWDGPILAALACLLDKEGDLSHL